MDTDPAPTARPESWAARARVRAARLLSGGRRRLYCIGTAKSGTHSVAEMFAPPVRSAHEPEHRLLIDAIVDAAAGRLPPERLAAWVRRRDRRLLLDVDSSHLNVWILDPLVREFPDARFVLTIRDCYSWMNSMTKHVARFRRTGPAWHKFAEFLRGGADVVHAPEERVLREMGLGTVDSYLSRWAAHNATALATVPADRLLVVRTDEITERAAEIAEFARLPVRCVRRDLSRTYVNPDRACVLDGIPRAFLEARAERHCRALMARYFPEIRGLGDARM